MKILDYFTWTTNSPDGIDRLMSWVNSHNYSFSDHFESGYDKHEGHDTLELKRKGYNISAIDGCVIVLRDGVQDAPFGLMDHSYFYSNYDISTFKNDL